MAVSRSQSKNNSRSAAGLFYRLESHGDRFYGAARLFLLAVGVLLAALVVWAATAEIQKVVRVEGRIIPAGRSQQIQHLEGGILDSIHVSEGARVRRGDLLLTIDGTTASANLSETKVKLASQRARAARLEAEANDKARVAFPSDLESLPVVNAERNLFSARRAKLDQDLLVHQNTIRQHSAGLDDVLQRQKKLSEELATAKQRLDMIAGMAGRGAASQMEMLDARSREQRLRTEMSDANGAIPKLKALIAEGDSRIEAAKAEFRTQARNELVATIGEVEKLSQTIKAAADRYKRTEIRSPIDGIVNRISVNTVGGVVKPGESLIELTPQTGAVMIEAKALPKDRGNLRKGLEASIRVSAYDAAEYGLLKGRVEEVSADSIQDGRNDPYYRVDVLVTEFPALYDDKPMIPGMTATSDIVTGHRTVLAYLLSPLRKFTYNMLRDSR